jgi:RNA polymerase sigma factor (sigma-70 family)
MISSKITLVSDEEMIRQYFPNQPEQCFETLYKRYVNKVYRRCLSMVKDPSKAEDFTHDIFLKVFNKLNAFQERSNFSTWLYSIAFNYCADQIRLAKRLPMMRMEDGFDYAAADTSDEQLYQEAIQLVSRAIEKLSDSEKALLHFKYEDGMSIAKIAHTCSLKESTVKMRLKRSREKIHRLCAEDSVYRHR